MALPFERLLLMDFAWDFGANDAEDELFGRKR